MTVIFKDLTIRNGNALKSETFLVDSANDIFNHSVGTIWHLENLTFAGCEISYIIAQNGGGIFSKGVFRLSETMRYDNQTTGEIGSCGAGEGLKMGLGFIH